VLLSDRIQYTDPSAPIPAMTVVDRRKIKKGEPGYVPPFMRKNLSTNKHRRMRLSRGQKEACALPVGLRLPDGKDGWDFIIFDGRALLRACRRLRLEVTSMDDVLDKFTGDPRIQLSPAGETIVTCMLKPQHTGVIQQKLITGKMKDRLVQLTAEAPIAMLTVDLGEHNLVACGAYTVGQRRGKLQSERLEAFLLPEKVLADFEGYRRDSDEHSETLRHEALKALSKRQQREVLDMLRTGADQARESLCYKYGLDLQALPWDKMSSNSTFIAQHLMSLGFGESATHVRYRPKRKASERTILKYDSRFAAEEKIKLTDETRRAWNEAIWECQRASQEFRCLSVRKLQLARAAVNWTLTQAKQRSRCPRVVVVVEDLNVRFMHGGGKRQEGWAGFFKARSEKRWFIQALHKAYTELPTNRGIHVMEVNPARTSITCTKCGYCDPENRYGEDFHCRNPKCKVRGGHVANADLDIATENLARVALSGPMPKAPKLK